MQGLHALLHHLARFSRMLSTLLIPHQQENPAQTMLNYSYIAGLPIQLNLLNRKQK
jgi:hypothetical protein